MILNFYDAHKIRNIAVLGHQGTGKTSLVESMLYVTGAINKKGEVEKGTTVSDYTVEEKKHLTSISASLVPIEWKDHKYNFLDTPGYSDYIGEVDSALEVVRGTIILIDASSGIQIGTEKAWHIVQEKKLPSIIFINKMDKDNIKFENILADIREKFGKRAVPFAWPIGREQDFEGFVNVVDMKARIYDGEKCVDAEIWEEKKPRVEELHNMIVESVAETSEELMDKFFNGEEFTTEEIHSALRTGIINGELIPVIVGSAIKDVGVHTLLDMLWDYLPAPTELRSCVGKNPETNEEINRHMSIDEPFSATVFKTIMDPFLGKICIFKVRSGKITRDQEVLISNNDTKIKMGPIFTLLGKEQIDLKEVHAGDIGAVAKMNNLFTGATLCDPKSPILYPEIKITQPTLYMCIEPKNKNDEDKISESLQRLNAEDPSFVLKRNHETSQFLIGGQGITHIEHVIEKMKNMFNVEVTLSDPKVVYRETIKNKSQAQGKFKKQSGGAGQYGDVHITFEPCDDDFIFEEKIFGGSVPKNYIPAVEKGLRDSINHGVLAGFPVIGVKATLYDGSYHAVDSSELAFKMAASISFKEGCKQANPTILEPIMKIDILVKDESIGDIMGDINKRRGRVLGMNPAKYTGYQLVEAEVPQAEVLKYTIDLKAMTHASGSFTMEFARYDEVPSFMIDKIIETAVKEREQR